MYLSLLPTPAKWRTSRPLPRRFGNASEVARAVVFLASDESAYTVGAEIQIDGGTGTL
jgi:NAD(P)-dependent dehydrogenase (short-subunit alcohol dehydrogenase family)